MALHTTTRKSIRSYVVAGLLFLGTLGLGAYLCNLGRQPLSPRLTLEPPTSATPAQQSTEALPTGTATLSATPTAPAPAGVCGQSGEYTVLILGSNVADTHGHPGTDMIRLARVDFSRKTVAVFALSRSLWVNVRRLELREPSITETTLGAVYYEAYVRSVATEKSGKMIDAARSSAQSVVDNFYVISNHYLVVNLDELPPLIDSIGGLPMDVPARTTDRWIGITIEPGPQILSGQQVMSYARAVPDSDFGRMQRNNLILNALRQRLLDPSVWPELPALYSQFRESFVSDLSPEQILSLICLLREVPGQNVVLDQIEPEWTSPGPSRSLLWDRDKVTSALKELELLP